MLNVLKFHLTEAGFNVLEADNGKDAIAVIMTTLTPVGLIITDLNTLIIDGSELATKIANFEEHKNILTLLMTSDICTAFSKDTLYKCLRSLLVKPALIMEILLRETEPILSLKTS